MAKGVISRCLGIVALVVNRQKGAFSPPSFCQNFLHSFVVGLTHVLRYTCHSHLALVEGLCEKGDSLIDSSPKEALSLYGEAKGLLTATSLEGESNVKMIDLVLQAIEIRRVRSFLAAHKNDRDALRDEEFYQETSAALKGAREGHTRYWPELVGIIALLLHSRSSYTLAEGMYRSCIGLMAQKGTPQLPLAHQHRILAEAKQSYKLLAISMQQNTLAHDLDRECESLTLARSPSLSPILPYSLVPLPIETEISQTGFLC